MYILSNLRNLFKKPEIDYRIIYYGQPILIRAIDGCYLRRLDDSRIKATSLTPADYKIFHLIPANGSSGSYKDRRPACYGDKVILRTGNPQRQMWYVGIDPSLGYQIRASLSKPHDNNAFYIQRHKPRTEQTDIRVRFGDAIALLARTNRKYLSYDYHTNEALSVTANQVLQEQTFVFVDYHYSL